MDPAPARPLFFATQGALRRWLEKNHDKTSALWIGFYKVGSGKKGLTYLEAVDEALCFGWIDGLVKRFDADAFMQRFTPRKAKSTWSEVNIRKIEALRNAGRVAPPGLAAFDKREETRERRLALLIADSASGKRLDLFSGEKTPAKA